MAALLAHAVIILEKIESRKENSTQFWPLIIWLACWPESLSQVSSLQWCGWDMKYWEKARRGMQGGKKGRYTTIKWAEKKEEEENRFASHVRYVCSHLILATCTWKENRGQIYNVMVLVSEDQSSTVFYQYIYFKQSHPTCFNAFEIPLTCTPSKTSTQ